MSRRWLLVGGGGHGRVVLDAVLALNESVAGIIDPGLRAGERIFGVLVKGGDEILDALDPAEIVLANGIGANPAVLRRRILFEHWRSRGFEFPQVRHPSAVVGLECQLGEGAQVMAGAVLQNRVSLGENTVVNTRASVDHDCIIGAHTFIAPGATLGGSIVTHHSVFIGAGAIILPGVTIGANALIGAGAVVRKSVPDRAVLAGNPSKKIGTVK